MKTRNSEDTLEIVTTFYGSYNGKEPKLIIKTGLSCICGLLLACIGKIITRSYIPVSVAICIFAISAAITALGFIIRFFSKYEMVIYYDPENWYWENPCQNNMILVTEYKEGDCAIPVFQITNHIESTSEYRQLFGCPTGAFKKALRNTIARHNNVRCWIIKNVSAKTYTQSKKW